MSVTLLYHTFVEKIGKTMHIKTIEVNIQEIADGRSTGLWIAGESTDESLVAFARDNLNLVLRILVDNLPY